MLRYTTQEIIEKFKLVHDNKYDYSNFEYRGSQIKSIIICKTHGEFLQHSNSHLSGQGCKKCFNERNILNFISHGWKKNVENRAKTFIEDCKIKNPNLIFDKTVYSGKNNKVIVTCPIHGDYKTNPRLLLDGVLCRKCYYENLHERWSRKGWVNYCNKNNIEIAHFYIIKMKNNNEEFIKFGITTKDVKVRMNKYPSSYKQEVIKIVSSNPDKIWMCESKMKKEYKLYKYVPQMKFGGSSQECLSIETLNEILNDKTMCCN